MKQIQGNLASACMNDIPRLALETMNSSGKLRTPFVSSEANFGAAWAQFSALTKKFPSIKFGNKRDVEDSYFTGVNGIQLSMRLASLQEWVRRKLMGTIESESSFQYLWERWERWRGQRENVKQWDKFLRDLQKPKAISLENPWMLVIVYMVPLAAGLSSIFFWLELQLD